MSRNQWKMNENDIVLYEGNTLLLVLGCFGTHFFLVPGGFGGNNELCKFPWKTVITLVHWIGQPSDRIM